MEQTANFLDLFLQGAVDAMVRLQPFAERLVAILATISVVLTFALGALRKDFDPVGTLIGKILLIGVIVWFITSWPNLLETLIEGALFLGTAAGGRNNPALVMQPISVISWGWDFANLCFRRVEDLSGPAIFFNLHIIIVLVVCGLTVAFAYLIIGVTIAVALVEFWIGSAVALILLPFAVFKPMAFIAQSTFGWVAANAMRLLLLSTIVSIGADAFDLVALVEPSIDEVNAEIAFAGTVIAVFLLALALSAQRMALGLINGAPQLSSGAVFTAGGAVVAGTTKAALSTIRGLTGASSAVAGAGRLAAARSGGTGKSQSSKGSMAKSNSSRGSQS